MPEEPLECPVDPHQRRILTPPVELPKPFVLTANRRQGTPLVVQADAFTGLLITVNPFLQRPVVKEPLLGEELGKVPMRVRG